jgi:hypothetical protein
MGGAVPDETFAEEPLPDGTFGVDADRSPGWRTVWSGPSDGAAS